MALPENDHISEQDYLCLDRESETRYEYIDGQVLAMAGASERHSSISATLNFLLYGALREGPCRVYASEMRVYVATHRAYFYPDITAVCGESQLMPGESVGTLLNPSVIIEILSRSTAMYDRTIKFGLYQQIPSLQTYLLVEQNRPHVDAYTRSEGDSWLFTPAEGLEASVTLPPLELTLALREVYERVDFSEGPDAG